MDTTITQASSTHAIEIIAIILAILLPLISAWAGLRTDILKESGSSSGPYSFSRFQVWLWTGVIAPIVVLRWGWVGNTGDVLEFNNTCLILLGISGGTTLTSLAVGDFQKTKANQVNAEAASEHAIQTEHDEDATPPAPVVTVKAIHGIHRNFIMDILTNDEGQLSVTRLQQLIFTIAYVVIFISIFFSSKTLPEFDSTAFTLMGISAGTYVVGKAMNK